jgi:hypothetical protein
MTQKKKKQEKGATRAAVDAAKEKIKKRKASDELAKTA